MSNKMQTPALFLPGTLCDERLWLPLWQHLTQVNRRYVPLQWANSLSDMLQLTSDRVLDDEKVHLIGFSMGGYVAARWAIENSHRVASLTLIGYCLSGLSQDEVSRRNDMLKYLKNNVFRPNNAFVSGLVHPSKMTTSAITETVLEMANDLGKSTLIAHTQATTPRTNLVKAIADLNLKLTIIGADTDTIAPAKLLRKEREQLNNANFHILPQAGHMMPLEYPHQLAHLLTQHLALAQ